MHGLMILIYGDIDLWNCKSDVIAYKRFGFLSQVFKVRFPVS